MQSTVNWERRRSLQNRTAVLKNTPTKRKRGRALASLVSSHTPVFHPSVSYPLSVEMMMYFWVSTEALQGQTWALLRNQGHTHRGISIVTVSFCACSLIPANNFQLIIKIVPIVVFLSSCTRMSTGKDLFKLLSVWKRVRKMTRYKSLYHFPPAAFH